LWGWTPNKAVDGLHSEREREMEGREGEEVGGRLEKGLERRSE